MIVCFDLDGTLVNTLEGIRYSANSVLKDFGLEEQSSEFYRKAIGHGARGLVETIIKKQSKSLDLVDEILEKFLLNYNENWMVGLYQYEGIEKLVSSLKQKGIKVAVNTNKPQNIAVKIVSNYCDSSMFKVIKGACDDYEKKPSTQGVNLILSEFKVLNNECIYIGDSIVDVTTAKNANIKSIGVLWGFGEKADVEKAEYLVKSADEISQIIIDNNK